MLRKCEICGIEFVCQRSTARYCSDRCRQSAHRGIVSVEPREVQPLERRMSDDEVSEVVTRAHGVAADLSRASMLTYAPLCLSLRSVSRKLTDALRKEGL